MIFGETYNLKVRARGTVTVTIGAVLGFFLYANVDEHNREYDCSPLGSSIPNHTSIPKSW